MITRWLTAEVVASLEKNDARFSREKICGPLVVEVHYKDGVPMEVKVRDWLRVPPPILDIHLTITT